MDIINKGRSHCLDIMQFVWRLTLLSAQHQIIIQASHIPGHRNSVADSLSRFRDSDSWHQPLTLFQFQSHRFQPPSSTDSAVPLVTASQDAILNSITPQMHSSYLTRWNCFKTFHATYSLSFPSLDVLTLSNFITFAHSR